MAGDSVPTFVPLDDLSVEVGSPLHVPIDGMDEEGGPLSVTVEIDDPSAVDAVVLSGNRSLRLDVGDFGVMTFELFEQRAPRPSSRVIELAESGFYEGIIFHRVVDDFIIQAGDPTGTGMSGSDLGVFDDQFHPDLQHNRGGVLSFAKTSDDTNNSQFFVTHAPARHLDFNHSIFGQLTEGNDVRQAIDDLPVDEDDRPLDDVVIDSATVFDDVENSVIMFRAADANQQTTATITITDADGNSSQQTINIDTVADLDNASPFLEPIDPVIYAVAGQPLTFPIEAIDIEGDDVRFGGQYASDPAGSTAALDPETGVLTMTPADDFVGTIDLIVAAFPTATNSEDLDSQVFTVEFIGSPVAPTLSANSDLGSDSSDGLTSADDLTFESTRLLAGQTVELVNTASGETVASAIADQGSVTFAADSFAVGPLADAAYELALRYLTFGQQGGISDVVALTIDRVAPSVDASSLEGHQFAGEPWSGQPTSEPEEPLVWSLLSAPDEMQIDSATGQLTWTASVDELGSQTISVGATDSAGNLSEVTFDIAVTSRHVNASDPFDVDANESVGALDALLIINAIGRAGGTIDLTSLDQTSGLDVETFYNVNGDTTISALDALVVINEMSRRGLSSEREFLELVPNHEDDRDQVRDLWFARLASSTLF